MLSVHEDAASICLDSHLLVQVQVTGLLSHCLVQGKVYDACVVCTELYVKQQ